MRRAKKQQDVTAIIYDKRGRILSIGKNSYVKTHPLQARYATEVGLCEQVFLHASTAKKRLQGGYTNMNIEEFQEEHSGAPYELHEFAELAEDLEDAPDLVEAAANFLQAREDFINALSEHGVEQG